ncbi:MAG: HD domain-containing protein [Anaerolineae bacterium]|nr:HD domain-containing protein [Anaerolineae bacterium]
MQQAVIIQRTAEHVRTLLRGEGSGHDWGHIWRVWQQARHIAQAEGADLFVVELAALLHDIADWKLHGGDEAVGPRRARAWLESLGVAEAVIAQVSHVIAHLSFKGEAAAQEPLSLAGQVVQDADRLDAIGAIGVARAFAYGGHAGQVIYDPEHPVRRGMDKAAYQQANTTTINHFYEKLLLLKDRMNTPTARALAEDRHAFMEAFLAQFYAELPGDAEDS